MNQYVKPTPRQEPMTSQTSSRSEQLVYILCFERLTRPCDRNFVDGRGVLRALDELSDLPFVVRSDYRYICKHCLGVLKKRNGLKTNLENWTKNFLMITNDFVRREVLL